MDKKFLSIVAILILAIIILGICMLTKEAGGDKNHQSNLQVPNASQSSSLDYDFNPADLQEETYSSSSSSSSSIDLSGSTL